MAERKAHTPDEPTEVVAVEPVEIPDSWGPYREYTMITTPYGTFGVPFGHILEVVPVKVKLIKTGEVIDSYAPKLTYVTIKDERLKPMTDPTRDQAEVDRLKSLAGR